MRVVSVPLFLFFIFCTAALPVLKHSQSISSGGFATNLRQSLEKKVHLRKKLNIFPWKPIHVAKEITRSATHVRFLRQLEAKEIIRAQKYSNIRQVSARQGMGFSGTPCESDDTCKGKRTCNKELFCGVLKACKSTNECETGEICAVISKKAFCTDKQYAKATKKEEINSGGSSERPSRSQPSPEATSPVGTTSDDQTQPGNAEAGAQDEVEDGKESEESGSGDVDVANSCIAIDSLQHLSREELVFEKDLLSNVLCDINHSCATAGHMVTYHGKAMMMKTYCDAVGGCVKKVMLVNSPRYRRKLSVPSKSDDLVFTAFSARYVTRGEEHVLSAVIRVGL